MIPASAPLPCAACFSSRSIVFASGPPAMRALRRMPSADEVRRRLASRDEYDEGLLDPTELQEYLERIIPSLSDSVWDRFCNRSLRQQHDLVGMMCGYEVGWKWCPWSSDEFMHMLLDNCDRRYPKVWQNTYVAGRLPRHVSVLPGVSKWLLTFTPNSSPPRVFIVIRDECTHLILRYEMWVLWEPHLREERVLAYRVQPDSVCSCCRQPSLWKLPRGRCGCAALVMRSVGRSLHWAAWQKLRRQLSRTQASTFEALLFYDWFNIGVFEIRFVDLDSLTCSCYACSPRETRAGVLCPHDQIYVDRELAGPSSPRRPSEHFAD